MLRKTMRYQNNDEIPWHETPYPRVNNRKAMLSSHQTGCSLLWLRRNMGTAWISSKLSLVWGWKTVIKKRRDRTINIKPQPLMGRWVIIVRKTFTSSDFMCRSRVKSMFLLGAGLKRTRLLRILLVDLLSSWWYRSSGWKRVALGGNSGTLSPASIKIEVLKSLCIYRKKFTNPRRITFPGRKWKVSRFETKKT